MKLSNMENNTKRRKDELNASASSRSSRASSSTVTNVTSRALESLEGSLSSLSQSEVVYNSQLVSSNEQDVLGVSPFQANKRINSGGSIGCLGSSAGSEFFNVYGDF